MPACHLTPQFIKAAQRIQEMDEDTIRTVVDGFLRGMPMSTLSARTGVPNEILNRMFTLPWREALAGSGIPKSHESPPAAEPQLDPTTLKAVAELKKCHIPKAEIREYLKLKPAIFEAHWDALLKERRRQVPQSLSAIGH